MEKSLEKIRHSFAHILAMAVMDLFKNVKLGIGPVIENGFYYDFDLPTSLKPEDLEKIEKKMRELIDKDLKFKKELISISEARSLFKDQPYKLELIRDLEKEGEKKVSIYRTNGFVDLCKGPHVKSTKELKVFKLLKVSGAYWKGDEKRPMLQRVYGVAFQTEKELDEFLKIQEEAKERDHIKLGAELELFAISEEVGQGLILWLPKGAILRQVMEDFIIQKYFENGYQLVRTPHIGSESLFSISGHLEHYKENMYAPIKIDKEKYYLKPMNCPFHLIIYKTSLKSYRDLPIRYAELGTVYRYEKSGVLHGLTRVRGFTQDDGHIICREDQLEKEIESAIKLTKEILETFGFSEFKVALSVRDPKNKAKYLGSDKMWSLAEKALAKGIKKVGWKFEREEGEAVFYGPKMDIKVKDALKREWQISTLQVDFNLPERFDIFYIDKNGRKSRPFMLHRALLGSLERFTGLLIEHFKGAFPTWLAPVQIKILPISDKYNSFAKKIGKRLKEENLRIEIDKRKESIGKKIREAELLKTPYMIIVGEKEKKRSEGKKEEYWISVRSYKKGELGMMRFSKFVEKVKKEIEKKVI